ncbi:MAG: type II toxin-antitoxin system VapC family toxin [Planctomycetia bacterium]
MIVIDAHVLVWWLARAPGLSRKAERALSAHGDPGQIVVSAISLLEIATAIRRGRLQLSMPLDQWLADMHSLPEIKVESVTAEIAVLAGGLAELMHGDPADRLIVATASTLDVPLVTGDKKLRAYRGVKTIW